MQSSAGSSSPHLRVALWLAGIALAALAVSLFLSFFYGMAVRYSSVAPATKVQTPVSRWATATMAPAPVTAAPSQAQGVPPIEQGPPPMWTLIRPWAIGADAVAVAGLLIVLIVRRIARSRGTRA